MVVWSRVLLAWSVGGSLAVAQAQVRPPDVLDGADTAWLYSWTDQAEGQAKLLQAAYDLDPDTHDQVLRELEARLVLQRDFEQGAEAELKELLDALHAAGNDPDSPENMAVGKKLNEIHRTMPLNEDLVAQWLEERLPPETVEQGRPRLDELRYRREQKRIALSKDTNRLAGAKKVMRLGRNARTAGVSPSGRPMPHGEKARPVVERAQRDASRRIVRPNRGVGRRPARPGHVRSRPQAAPAQGASAKRGSKQAGRKSSTGRAKAPAKAGARAGYVKAPPLDEWDKYVAKVVEKYAFTEAQVTKARSILRDLRRRAHQYQLSRSADFARAGSMEDKKARTARLAELKAPLDALFTELKLRLESLPTVEQRLRAGAPKSKSKSGKKRK